MTKILHDHECEKCGAVATHNLQQNWQLYSISPCGNFKLSKEWGGDTNEFYCENCYEEEMSITN